MMLRRIESLDEYRESLDRDPVELAALFEDFLIRVTEFFRDPPAFQTLRLEVLPALCEGRSPKAPIRVWVPGCATGEEVYSVAIALLEYVGDGCRRCGSRSSGPTSARRHWRRRARACIP